MTWSRRSLNVRVRETVPDAVFDRADAVELVDLTPDDLIQRPERRQGLRSRNKPSAPRTFLFAGQSHRIARSSPCAAPPSASTSNCSRKCRRMPSKDRGRRANAFWSAISDDPRSASLVRYAKRLADRLHGPWVALYVEAGAACSFRK